jgi:hypothetical protein
MEEIVLAHLIDWVDIMACCDADLYTTSKKSIILREILTVADLQAASDTQTFVGGSEG